MLVVIPASCRSPCWKQWLEGRAQALFLLPPKFYPHYWRRPRPLSLLNCQRQGVGAKIARMAKTVRHLLGKEEIREFDPLS